MQSKTKVRVVLVVGMVLFLGNLWFSVVMNVVTGKWQWLLFSVLSWVVAIGAIIIMIRIGRKNSERKEKEELS